MIFDCVGVNVDINADKKVLELLKVDDWVNLFGSENLFYFFSVKKMMVRKQMIQ